jgi:hypothetical protein
MTTRILIAALVLMAGSYAEAATFEVFREGNKVAIIEIRGTIHEGDEEVFRTRVSGLPTVDTTIVRFDSTGGNLYAGIVIGEMIRQQGFMTVVQPRALCASVCALAWMGGVKRGLYPSSRIGFHAAHHRDTKKVMANANALIGAYLTRMGYSYQTVWWLLAKGEDMQWLTSASATANGIEHVALKEEPPELPPPIQVRPSQSVTNWHMSPAVVRRSVLDQLFGPQR